MFTGSLESKERKTEDAAAAEGGEKDDPPDQTGRFCNFFITALE